ncbi:hypothetical protein BH23GEM10_BH23GEM10_00440 [soil metagenome]
MGILKHLLFWPVTGPLFLADFSLGKVEGVVREELTDDTRIKSELMELQMKLELGDIDDDQYVEMEAAIMLQLREIRHWREQFGMGVSGGPVRVQADQSAAVVTDEDTQDAAAEAETDRQPHVAESGGASVEINLDWD